MLNKNVDVEKTLSGIISHAARRPDFILTLSGTFEDLGLDSLEVVQILVAIENAFDIDLEDKDLKNIGCMGQFIDYIKEKVAERSKLFL